MTINGIAKLEISSTPITVKALVSIFFKPSIAKNQFDIVTKVFQSMLYKTMVTDFEYDYVGPFLIK